MYPRKIGKVYHELIRRNGNTNANKRRLYIKKIIAKRVKQGCLLISSLFNLGIDSLIRNIRERYQECGYNYDKEERKVIQACADDLLVFADTREHLNN
jgi:hypothetical protein